MEIRNFPGLIFDDQMTKFHICIKCCEIFSHSTLAKLLKHECEMKTKVLQDKPIETIERRTMFHNSNYLKQFYTELSVDTIKCNECNCELKKIAELKEHLRKVHEINPSNHMCPECGNRYASAMMVRQHQVEKHDHPSDFLCELCNRAFAEKCFLTNHHKLFHTDEKPHVCDVCALYR